MSSYDIILFGVTGFCGKLTLLHLLQKEYSIKLALCSRNASKAQKVVTEVMEECSGSSLRPDVLEADLVCTTPEEEETLRKIVKQAKVCLSTAGPFERYGQTLVKLCAEEGVHYADITGETDFVRLIVGKYDAIARSSGAVICVHCGNDAIPWDCSVLEMSKFAKSKGCTLSEVNLYTELSSDASPSGGTLTTAKFQRAKQRGAKTAEFDEMLTDAEGRKSKFSLKNASPKSSVYVEEFQKSGGPWIMTPVMVNAIRRSNALLGYADNLKISEMQLSSGSTVLETLSTNFNLAVWYAGIAMPSLFGSFIPGPGEGPSRETMNAAFLKLRGRATMIDNMTGEEKKISTEWFMDEHSGYIGTARMLAEAGMLLLDKGKGSPDNANAGVVTPACAFGSSLLDRLKSTTCTTFSISTQT